MTHARLHTEAPRGYEEDPAIDAKVYEGLHIAAAFERADGVRRPVQPVRLPAADLQPAGVDAGRDDRSTGSPPSGSCRSTARTTTSPHYVAISDADRHPDLGYAATIHHGIDLARFTFRPEPGGYLLFLGRIHPDKGTHRAIEVARRAGLPLVIAGIVQDREYFRERVEPHLGRPDVTLRRRGRAGGAGRACWAARSRCCT